MKFKICIQILNGTFCSFKKLKKFIDRFILIDKAVFIITGTYRAYEL